jgi:hypothetical protein
MAAKASATAFALREDAEGADDPVPLWERAELCDRLTNLYLAFADDLEGQRTPGEVGEDAPERLPLDRTDDPRGDGPA